MKRNGYPREMGYLKCLLHSFGVYFRLPFPLLLATNCPLHVVYISWLYHTSEQRDPGPPVYLMTLLIFRLRTLWGPLQVLVEEVASSQIRLPESKIGWSTVSPGHGETVRSLIFLSLPLSWSPTTLHFVCMVCSFSCGVSISDILRLLLFCCFRSIVPFTSSPIWMEVNCLWDLYTTGVKSWPLDPTQSSFPYAGPLPRTCNLPLFPPLLPPEQRHFSYIS